MPKSMSKFYRKRQPVEKGSSWRRQVEKSIFLYPSQLVFEFFIGACQCHPWGAYLRLAEV